MSRNILNLLALLLRIVYTTIILLLRIVYTTIIFFSLILVFLVFLIFATLIFASLILLISNNSLIPPIFLFSGLVVGFSILFERIVFESSESIHYGEDKGQYITNENSYSVYDKTFKEYSSKQKKSQPYFTDKIIVSFFTILFERIIFKSPESILRFFKFPSLFKRFTLFNKIENMKHMARKQYQYLLGRVYSLSKSIIILFEIVYSTFTRKNFFQSVSRIVEKIKQNKKNKNKKPIKQISNFVKKEKILPEHNPIDEIQKLNELFYLHIQPYLLKHRTSYKKIELDDQIQKEIEIEKLINQPLNNGYINFSKEMDNMQREKLNYLYTYIRLFNQNFASNYNSSEYFNKAISLGRLYYQRNLIISDEVFSNIVKHNNVLREVNKQWILFFVYLVRKNNTMTVTESNC